MKLQEIVNKYDGNKNLPLDISGVKLTDREEEILKYIGQGLLSDEIAVNMNLGKRTIDKARTEIMQKFDLKSLPALISFAIHYNEGIK